MNLDTVFPSKYLKASDLPEVGQSFTIEEIKMEEVGREKDQKPVIYFQGEDKGFVCNKTNKNTMKKLFGTVESEDLIGKTIKLISMEVPFGDEMVESIRISIKSGGKTGKAAVNVPAPKEIDEDGDEIPF